MNNYQNCLLLQKLAWTFTTEMWYAVVKWVKKEFESTKKFIKLLVLASGTPNFTLIALHH